MNKIKIYIHHQYDKSLFYKLFHNTKNINVTRDGETTYVSCEYGNTKLDLIFTSEIHDNKDGLHLLDWFTKYYEVQDKTPDLLHDNKVSTHDYVITKRLYEIVKDKKDWIVSILRTEKIYVQDYERDQHYDLSHQVFLQKIASNNKIVTDNFYLSDVTNEIKYTHVITNTLFQWNEVINIRWFYEFKEIFSRLNFKYDIGFSIRHIKPHRLEILNGLFKLNNKKIFLQVSDFLYTEPDNEEFKPNELDNGEYDADRLYGYNYINDKLDRNIKVNSLIGTNHFDDLSVLKSGFGFGLDFDLFFRYLSKSKIQILDESWAFFNAEFSTQYLSEKTIGYLLCQVPFIPTHTYPLRYIQDYLGAPEYPFYKEVNNFKFEKNGIVNFVKKFMDDFDCNYNLLYQWTETVHNIYLNKILNENSLIDLINSNFNELPKHNTKPLF